MDINHWCCPYTCSFIEDGKNRHFLRAFDYGSITSSSSSLLAIYTPKSSSNLQYLIVPRSPTKRAKKTSAFLVVSVSFCLKLFERLNPGKRYNYSLRMAQTVQLSDEIDQPPAKRIRPNSMIPSQLPKPSSAFLSNPLQIKPLGNLLFRPSNSRTRSSGLGTLAALPDEVLLSLLFTLLDGPDLITMAGVSRVFFAWSHVEGIWKGVYISVGRIPSSICCSQVVTFDTWLYRKLLDDC